MLIVGTISPDILPVKLLQSHKPIDSKVLLSDLLICCECNLLLGKFSGVQKFLHAAPGPISPASDHTEVGHYDGDEDKNAVESSRRASSGQSRDSASVTRLSTAETPPSGVPSQFASLGLDREVSVFSRAALEAATPPER